MLWSLLVKLGMFALTMGVIVWIGWTVPHAHNREAGQMADVQQREEPNIAMATGLSNTAMPVPSVLRSEAMGHVGRSRVNPTLDLNRATEQDLESLPGIGPVLAERIVAYRREAGLFQHVEDLRAVKGIGKKKFEKIKALVSVTPATRAVREGKKTT